MAEREQMIVHKMRIEHDEEFDPESAALLKDLVSVMRHLLQYMPVVGGWFEDRVTAVGRGSIASHLNVTRNAQIYDPLRPKMRSRSWDIVVYDPRHLADGLPRSSPMGAGPPLLAHQACRMLIDTKSCFADPRTYAELTAFDKNCPNDLSEITQIDLIGPNVPKVLVFAVVEGRRPKTLHDQGCAHNLEVYTLATTKKVSGSILDGLDDREYLVRGYIGPGSFRQFLDRARAL